MATATEELSFFIVFDLHLNLDGHTWHPSAGVGCGME